MSVKVFVTLYFVSVTESIKKWLKVDWYKFLFTVYFFFAGLRLLTLLIGLSSDFSGKITRQKREKLYISSRLNLEDLSALSTLFLKASILVLNTIVSFKFFQLSMTRHERRLSRDICYNVLFRGDIMPASKIVIA